MLCLGHGSASFEDIFFEQIQGAYVEYCRRVTLLFRHCLTTKIFQANAHVDQIATGEVCFRFFQSLQEKVHPYVYGHAATALKFKQIKKESHLKDHFRDKEHERSMHREVVSFMADKLLKSLEGYLAAKGCSMGSATATRMVPEEVDREIFRRTRMLFCGLHDFFKAYFRDLLPFIERSNYEIKDVFGRYIMMPIEQMHGINGHKADQQASGFAREFCRPVLNAVKHYVIGAEKYDKLNAYLVDKILKISMSQCVGKQFAQDVFETEQVKKYMCKYYGKIIAKVRDKSARDKFTAIVNSGLPRGVEELEFTLEHLGQAVSAWSVVLAKSEPDLALKLKIRQ